MPRLLVALTVCALPLIAADGDDFFESKIRPLLATHCHACHTGSALGSLRLDSRDGVLAGGKSGKAVIVGKPEASLLIEAVKRTHVRLKMPPVGALSPEEVANLEEWIRKGVPWPEKQKQVQTSASKISKEQKAFWSFQPLKPASSESIDSLLNAKIKAAKIKPARPADPRAWLRRATLSLTGLLPTPEETEAFAKDPNKAKAIDRLLDSPQYGERWARHWLDLARYSDGELAASKDTPLPNAWRYRDWVISAFNNDLPFNTFAKAQITETPDQLAGLGFQALGAGANDQLDVTTKVFLGLTVGCAQCHDHKYDPLSQADHYRMRAFFAGIKSRDDLVIDLPEVCEEIESHNASLKEKIAALRAKRVKETATEEEKIQQEALDTEIAALDGQIKSPRMAMGVRDNGPVAEPTFVLYQGDFHSPREQVSPGFPSVLFPGSVIPESPSPETTGRRLALAEWITSEKNPWTARVLVNRIWQQHFGTGLVATPNDFGYTGARPPHTELLDWLAIWLMENDWSVKKLHRLIVMSETYQQSSVVADDSDAANAAKASSVDPENQLLWRQNIRRLDAETLRDSLLAVSGLLSSYDSGRPMWPAVPDDLLHAQPAILEALKNDDGGRMQGWYTDPVDQVDVRSLFVIRKRCLPVPFLQAFDLPDSTVSCARRDTTVVAPQALMLLNSPEGIRYADAFADRT